MSAPTNFAGLVNILLGLIRPMYIIIVGLALLAFMWGLVKFLARSGGNETDVKEGKALMVWGVLALFVMVSVWGIIRLFTTAFGFN